MLSSQSLWSVCLTLNITLEQGSAFERRRTQQVAAEEFPGAAFLSHAASSDVLLCSVTGWMKQFKLYPQQSPHRNELMMALMLGLLRVLPEDKSERIWEVWRTENHAMILLELEERNPVFEGVSWVLSASLVEQSLTGLFRMLTKAVFTTFGRLCGSYGKIQTVIVKSWFAEWQIFNWQESLTAIFSSPFLN